MQFVNCTPHSIVLNNGKVYQASGEIARISSSYTAFDDNGCCQAVFGAAIHLPEPVVGIRYIVSGMVAAAVDRNDLVAPATGHPECVRKEGRIVSVPGFIKA